MLLQQEIIEDDIQEFPKSNHTTIIEPKLYNNKLTAILSFLEEQDWSLIGLGSLAFSVFSALLWLLIKLNLWAKSANRKEPSEEVRKQTKLGKRAVG